jgi:hypothetical protein
VSGEQAGDGAPTERLDLVPSAPPPPPGHPTGATEAPRQARHRWIIPASIAVLAAAGIVVAFFVGTVLRAEPAALSSAPVTATSTPSASASATASPTPVPPVLAAGPAAPGVHPWDELTGGECLAPYLSPWELEFTVVDCAAPHQAQFTYHGAFPDPAGAAYPGEGGITSQLNLLCSAPNALDLAAAGQYPDLQTQAAYPVGQAQWDAGDRAYSCFVSRSSGEPLTGTLAPAP